MEYYIRLDCWGEGPYNGEMLKRIVFLMLCSVFVLGISSDLMAEDRVDSASAPTFASVSVSEITKNVVMKKGKVFVDEYPEVSFSVDEALSQESSKDLAKSIVDRKEREVALDKSVKSLSCLCPACLSPGYCPPHSCPIHHWIGPSCQSCPY